VTPLQLVQAVSIIAAEGVPHPLHLLRAVQSGIDTKAELVPPPAAKPNVIKNPADWRAVQKGMIEVVNSGTAHGLNDKFPYQIAGKTGTAERFSRTTEEWTSIMDSPIERHQVLFEAFAPADGARIAIIVALEAGRSGAHDAAPIAKKILEAWLPGDLEREAAAGHTTAVAETMAKP